MLDFINVDIQHYGKLAAVVTQTLLCLLACAVLSACADDSRVVDVNASSHDADKTLPDAVRDGEPLGDVDLQVADARHPDTRSQACTCIPTSAWSGYSNWYGCECLGFDYGCVERPEKFNLCDLPRECLAVGLDLTTGCARPEFVSSGDISCSCNAPADLPQTNSDAGGD